MSKQLNEFLESEEGKIAEFAVNIRSASVKDYAERVELEVFKNIGERLVPKPTDFDQAFEHFYGKEEGLESIEEKMNWNEAKKHFSRGWHVLYANMEESLTEYGEDILNELES